MPLNINFQQIFLHAFNFIILFGILYFLLYSPVKKFMEKRAEYYKNMDDEVKKKLEDAENVKKSYEEKTANCEEEIREMKNQALTEAAAKREGIVAQAHKEADRIMEEARGKAAKEHEVMISDTKREIEAIVAEAEKELIGKRTVSDEYDTFLNTVDKKDSGND